MDASNLNMHQDGVLTLLITSAFLSKFHCTVEPFCEQLLVRAADIITCTVHASRPRFHVLAACGTSSSVPSSQVDSRHHAGCNGV
eukprot:292791-Chlamydomonas_euryale.AAC.8